MNSSSLRRLAKDQASLYRSTPPNYLFESGSDSTLPDDLTQLTILLTGAHGTPYSQGLWRLHLKMPDDYPQSPPKATFKTRIYHPNVEESTGAVCLDTLKRDWDSKLTLTDILITISCLLIHPNPDSALNSAAGALLQEDYEAFSKQAKLMTSIHAPIPKELRSAVIEAKRRGEDDGCDVQSEEKQPPPPVRASSSNTSVVMKKAAGNADLHQTSVAPETSDEEHECEEGKENDPSQSPSLAIKPPASPGRRVLGKRPLSELPALFDLENGDALEFAGTDESTVSGKDALANAPSVFPLNPSAEPLRKSPKLAKSIEETSVTNIYEDPVTLPSSTRTQSDEKENSENSTTGMKIDVAKSRNVSTTSNPSRPSLRKVSNVGSSRGSSRTGIRRL